MRRSIALASLALALNPAWRANRGAPHSNGLRQATQPPAVAPLPAGQTQPPVDQASVSPARTSASLNATWEFLPDAAETYTSATLPSAGWRPIRVPMSIQAQFSDLRDFAGAAWYRRSFAAPAAAPDTHVLLRFGAVDYLTEVWVNGREIGIHEGGYTPFDFDITSALQPGNNTLLLRVTDPPGPVADFNISYRQIPHGKQDWYVQTTGIWQDVTLEVRPAYYIEMAHAITEGSSLRGLELRIAHPEQIAAGAKATIEIETPGGTELTRSAPLPSGQREVFLRFLLDHQLWWSPETPNLYRFRVTLPDGDVVNDQFGFRTIETRNGRIYLNGDPFYLIGALDQDFYPEGVYTPPSLDYILGEMRLGRSLGLNTLRCHIKVPDPRYLEAADKTGMLIWYEIPNWDDLTDLSKRRGLDTLAAMIDRDWNHPSIIIHSIINESWGIDMKHASQRAWLSDMYTWAKQHVPNRLVDDNSACCDDFHVATDLADFHQYYSMPDDADEWDRWVKDFAARPAWLYSSYGDARTNRQEPLIVSEFGNWGLPQLPAELPWWFSRDFNGREITLPAGVHERFIQYKLPRLFRDYPTLATAAQWHEWSSLAHEITTIRREPSIQGYVITEFTDINWESNGLISMWRAPKAFHQEIAALQQPIVVLATADKPDYAPGESARLELSVSNYSPSTLSGATLSVAETTIRLDNIPAGSVLGPTTLEIPVTQRATGLQTVSLELHDARGTLINARELPLAVIAPVPHTAAAVELGSFSPEQAAALRASLTRQGYRLSETARASGAESAAAAERARDAFGPTAAEQAEGGFGTAQMPTATVLLTSRWDQAAQAAAEAGRPVVVLADSADALFGQAADTKAEPSQATSEPRAGASPSGGQVNPSVPAQRPTALPLLVRREKELRGDWVSNFDWLDTTRPPFAAFKSLGSIAGWEMKNVTPHFLIGGIEPNQYQNVIAGMFLGWIHENHALAIEARHGPGRVLLTTLNLAPTYGKDAYATALFDSILSAITARQYQTSLQF